jgi:serine/threonine-protein kinase RsbT
MLTELKFTLEGGDFERAGTASSVTKKVLQQLKIDPKVVKRMVVALYEGEVNIAAHTNRGVIAVSVTDHQIRAILKDEGPGIEDIDRAMLAGFSTASSEVRQMGFGAGMGLPNMKKNADNLQIISMPGVGTTVTMTFEY